jgi:hypothetical protein
VYDCRWQLLFGWRDPDNPTMNAALAEWSDFTTETAADAATLRAVRAAVAAGDVPATTSEEAGRRAQRWRDHLEAVPFLRVLAEQNSLEAEGAADALLRAAVALLGHRPN